jgi:hypothetical protein
MPAVSVPLNARRVLKLVQHQIFGVLTSVTLLFESHHWTAFFWHRSMAISDGTVSSAQAMSLLIEERIASSFRLIAPKERFL